MEKKNNRTLKKIFGVFQASKMFASYERRVLEGDRSTTILHNFIQVLESCEMHPATEIARRKQIVQDFHELKSEIMSLLGMNQVQIEMLDTQSIIQEAILQEKCVGRKERKAIERELEKIKIQFSKLEKDLKLKDEIIEEQLVYASTQEDYYQYKIKYNQLSEKMTAMTNAKINDQKKADADQKKAESEKRADQKKKEKKIKDLQDQMGRAKADNEKIKNESTKKSAEIRKLSGQLERTKIQLEKKNKSDKEHKDLQQTQKKKIESQQREIENLEKQNEDQRLKIVKILERPKTAAHGALECTICAEEYVESHLPTSLKCGHVFGRDCIEGWLTKKKVCPTCSAHASVQDFRTLYLV